MSENSSRGSHPAVPQKSIPREHRFGTLFHTKFNEKSAIHNARRKRLWLDFEKDEAEKLKLIPRDFQLTFKMTKKEVKEEMDKFGDSLEKFYIHCENKFGKRNKQMSTRGRPKKNKIK